MSDYALDHYLDKLDSEYEESNMPKKQEERTQIGKVRFNVEVDIYIAYDPAIKEPIKEETLATTWARLRMLGLTLCATILGFKFEINEENTTNEVVDMREIKTEAEYIFDHGGADLAFCPTCGAPRG